LYRLFIFDLDGTLYRGSEGIPYASDCLHELRRRGAEVRYVTNNSAARPEAVVKKLIGFGIEASADEVLSSGLLACQLAAEAGHRRVALMGEPPLQAMAEAHGLIVTDENPDMVLAGICRTADYAMLDRLSAFIRGGTPFWATNLDATYPLEQGREQPGAGAMIAALCVAGGRQPDRVIGKPQPDLILAAMRSAQCAPSETLVIGDRYDTDILAGQAAGCDTWMVLTGVATELPEGVQGSSDLRGLMTWTP
jgi:4-nitrophenyl phosphatase